MFDRLKRLLGAPKDPLSNQAHKAMSLTVLFAWIGLGADGLSSSCYGPEQAFLALGHNYPLALWLAIATFVTVFIIAFAYNYVIRLFPDGGGGYKVATRLINPFAGVIAGSALLIDYLLTIVISVASGTAAIFSFLPPSWSLLQVPFNAVVIMFLTYLNMRGMKESIKVLLPIFIGFVVVHLFLIVYGIMSHSQAFPLVVHNAVADSHQMIFQSGMIFTVAIFLHAYAQGGGTYTGLEAVSNNVNILAEPRDRTGKRTMFYMALSLAITAAGIILLYLLWEVQKVPHQTLNATVFSHILGEGLWGHIGLYVTLLLEAGLLYVAANTGFLGGPAVLANMAVDEWMPKVMLNLSNQLVKQNGILFFGLAAILLLFITKAKIATLVVLYSVSVFLAFTIALAGLVLYLLRHYEASRQWWTYLILISLGTLICGVIFVLVVITSFTSGSWLALLLLGAMVGFCMFVKHNYRISNHLVKNLDKDLFFPIDKNIQPLEVDKDKPTAVIFVGKSRGAAMHTLLNIQKSFRNYYQNFVFVSVGVVDSHSFAGRHAIKAVDERTNRITHYLSQFCWTHQLPATERVELAVEPLQKIKEVAQELAGEYSDSTFFASQLIFADDAWGQKIIHNSTAFILQRAICKLGLNMMIFPVRVKVRRDKAKPSVGE